MHSSDRLMMIIGAVVLIIVLGSAMVFGSNPVKDTDNKDGTDYVKDLTSMSQTIDKSGELAAGANESIAIPQGRTIIKNITAVLTWVDETQRPGIPRLRRYENMPDTFSLSVLPPDGNATEQSAANPAGGEGRIEISLSVSNNDLNAAIGSAISTGTPLPDWGTNVVLTDAGDWRAVLPPRIIGFKDDANSYILEITVEYYDISGLMPE